MVAAVALIPAFTAVASAGGIAAAVGTMAAGGLAGFATFASIAGGVLSGIGALTGKKDLQRFGGLLALGGGAAQAIGALGGLGGAAEGAASAAGTAAEGATDAITAAGQSASSPFTSALSQTEPLGTLGMPDSSGLFFGQAAPSGLDAATDQFQSGLMQRALGNAADVGQTIQGGQATQGQPLVQNAQPPSINTQAGAQSLAKQDAVQQAASGMDKNSLSKYLQPVNAVGKWIKDNQELVKIGGEALASMYGPQAEQLDWQRSIMQRRLANLNSPIVLRGS